MISTIGRWTIEHQPDATRQCYSAKATGTGCNCEDCQYVMAVIDTAFPQEFLSTMDILGVDIRKPAELCHYDRDTTGRRIVGGWFHIVGRILLGDDVKKEVAENRWICDFEKLADELEFGFSNDAALVSESFAGQRLIQLEFVTRVPWVRPKL